MFAKNFIHPTDKALTEKIFEIESLRSWLEEAHEEEFDEVCAYVYSASLPEITDEALVKMMNLACEKFEIPPVKLYLKRSYEFDVETVGYHEPVIILPAALVERGDAEIIQGRIFSAAAAIVAKHPRLAFLLWLAENLGGVMNFPIIGTAAMVFFYEWNRARQYSLDRAFLMGTENFSLSLKNILYGVVPFEVLENFSFDEGNDSFLEQSQRYMQNDNLAQILGRAYSFFMDYAWLPSRYEELKNFYAEMESDTNAFAF